MDREQNNSETLSDNEIVNIGWNLGRPGAVVSGEIVAKLLNNLKREQERNQGLRGEVTRLKKGPITHAETEMVLDAIEIAMKKLAEARINVNEIRPLREVIHLQGVEYRKLLTKIQNWEEDRKNAVFSKGGNER